MKQIELAGSSAVFSSFDPAFEGSRICFSIPGEVTDGFLSQIAMFGLVLRSLPAPLSRARLVAYLGCEDGVSVPDRWQPYLKDVDIRLIRRPDGERHHMVQATHRFTETDSALDYVILCDADTLMLGGIGDVLRLLAVGYPVAGVIAHLPPPRFTNDTWHALSTQLTNAPIALRHRYTLLPPETADAHRSPYYLNHGFLAFRADALRAFSAPYLEMRKTVAGMIERPIFAGQVSLSLTLHALGWHGAALPMRFNFPNDSRAFELHRYEAQDIRVLHFLRERNYRRADLFASETAFRDFMKTPPDDCDRILFDALARLTGGVYPFR